MSERDKRGDVELSGGAVLSIRIGVLLVAVAVLGLVFDAMRGL